MTFAGRDALEVDALRTDRYLESLLAAHERRAADAPADPDLDPSVRDAATRLGRDLVRLHPSFRFEERLAARLAQVAASMRLPAAAGAEGVTIGLLPPALPDADVDPARDPDDVDLEVQAGLQAIPRPILIGGALTSAALSIAGAAWVAWRRSRPPQTRLD
ncbi:MAG TPA: hypothetical protein VFR14_07200 [Candidatus Limnocylindrales bacterium]|nr:hypothetical protein [Candidatus Limnocylindrales bacterium]